MDPEFNAASLRIAALAVRMTGLGIFITVVLSVATLMASFSPATSAPEATDEEKIVAETPAPIEKTSNPWGYKAFAAKASINQKEDAKAGQNHGHPCKHHQKL